METPLDLLSRAAVLVREQDVATCDKETSDTASDRSVHSSGSPLASKSRKRRSRPDDDEETLSDPPTATKQLSSHRTRKRRSALLRPQVQERNGRSHSASPVASPTATPSPCSCCGSTFPCAVPLRPMPFHVGSAVFSTHPYLQVQDSSGRHNSSLFPLQTIHPMRCSTSFRPSGHSAFTRPVAKWSHGHGSYSCPDVYTGSSFDAAENSQLMQGFVSLNKLPRPIPVLPHSGPVVMPRLHLPLDLSNETVRKSDHSRRGMNHCQRKENSESPTATVIDEHFRRSLAGDRLRQFYPFPTSDGDSVDDHFKRALGEDWDRVESNIQNPSAKRTTQMQLFSRTEKKPSLRSHWSLH